MDKPTLSPLARKLVADKVDKPAREAKARGEAANRRKFDSQFRGAGKASSNLAWNHKHDAPDTRVTHASAKAKRPRRIGEGIKNPLDHKGVVHDFREMELLRLKAYPDGVAPKKARKGGPRGGDSPPTKAALRAADRNGRKHKPCGH